MSDGRGYRRIPIAPPFITALLRGPWAAECLDHIPDDLELEDVRMTDLTRGNVEVLVSSAEFRAQGELLHPTARWDAPTWSLTYRRKEA